MFHISQDGAIASRCLLSVVVLAVAALGFRSENDSALPQTPSPPTALPQTLRSPAAFDLITDREARSQALFLEVSKALLHPRCANCHPAGDQPLQGDMPFRHDPPVTRGIDGNGGIGMECSTCHQDRNQKLTRVPGAPNWHLAPSEMAWVGKSPREIAEQLKDPARNGGKTLEEIHHHIAHDALVAWGWTPGGDRAPAPGSQAALGELFRAWIDSGAVVPERDVFPIHDESLERKGPR